MVRITNIDDLMFPVELRPIYTDIEIDGKKTQLKVPNNKIVINSKSGNPLGVVSNSYKLISNSEAIELGRKCCREVFGKDEAESIEIFNVDAPSTASYCHVDLVHKNYIMNLWDEEQKSDVYIPYIRITNSYNTLRALKFDIGFCRKICFNGIIFESETIKFTFSHVKYKLKDDISFALEKGKMQALFKKFASYAKRLKSFPITADDSLQVITTLFGIKDKSDIDFDDKKEDKDDYLSLIADIKKKLKKYTQEFGSNGYALFNVITDIASHSVRNRYFRRDMNSMQRKAGNWINSFQKEIATPSFDITSYIQLLRESPHEALHLSGSRHATTRR